MPGQATINDRLAELARVFSQSEIARRTGVPQPSISRYLAGQRVPAEACARIVEGLGVRAAWLLAGQGMRSCAGADDPQPDTAMHLKRVLMALTTDAEVVDRVATKTGVRHLQRLMDLMARYRDTHSQLVSALRPMVESVSSRLHESLGSGAMETPADTWTTCDLLVDLASASDDGLRGAGASTRSTATFDDGDRALAARRAVFRSRLLSEPADCERYFGEQYDYVASLQSRGLLAEALRATAALLVFHSPRARHAGYQELNILRGLLEIELGALDAGIQRLQDSLPLAGREHATVGQGFLLAALVLRGSADLESSVRAILEPLRALDGNAGSAAARQLLWLAIALDASLDSGTYEVLVAEATLHRGDALEELAPLCAEARDDATDAGVRAAITREAERLETDTRPYVEGVDRVVLAAHLARRTGHECARLLVERSHSLVSTPPDGVLPRLLARYLHYSNVHLHPELCGDGSTPPPDAARSFLTDHVERGYLAFRPALEAGIGSDGSSP